LGGSRKKYAQKQWIKFARKAKKGEETQAVKPTFSPTAIASLLVIF